MKAIEDGKKHLTIIQINAVYGVRSTGRNVAEMDVFFKKQGFNSYIVATRLTQKYDNVYQIGNRLEWYLHQGMSRLTGFQGYYSLHSTKKMLDWVDKVKPDIIHLNNLRAGAFHFPLLFKYLHDKKIPVVLTLHDCYMFTGRCWHYSVKGCYQWQTYCRKCPSSEMCERSWFFDFTKKLFEDKKKWLTGIDRLAVVGVSDWITKEARKSFLKNASIITSVYNWVDLKRFKPADTGNIEIEKKRLGIEKDFVVLCIASGFSREKGIREILYLGKNLPNIKIILVGRLNEKISLPGNIIPLGTINDISKLALFYSLADVMVTPSPEETFGKTTAEAMACGTPVIGYNMTATAELISDHTGILVEYTDGADGILRAVKKMMGSGKQSYSDSCRRFAEVNFDMETNIQKYVDIYTKLIDFGDIQK